MSDDVKVFPNDRDYTYEAMMEQFNLIELDLRDDYYKRCASTPEKIRKQLDLVSLHYRDKSWQECKCSFEKHLPTVLGLAKDGLRNAQNKEQKDILGAIRDDSLRYKRRLEEGQLTKQEAEDFGDWIELAINEMRQMENKWGVCVISTNNYLDTITGLSGEGVGFTEDETEKKYMRNVRDNARSYAYRMASGNISRKEADSIREWAREQRRRLSRQLWVGDLPKTSRKDEDEEKKYDKPPKKIKKKKPKKVSKVGGDDKEDCPTCTLVPEKYRNKSKANEDYRFVSVPTTDGGMKQMQVSKQGMNRDINWIRR